MLPTRIFRYPPVWIIIFVATGVLANFIGIARGFSLSFILSAFAMTLAIVGSAVTTRIRIVGLLTDRKTAEATEGRYAASKAILDPEILTVAWTAIALVLIYHIVGPPSSFTLFVEGVLLVGSAAVVYFTAVFASDAFSLNVERIIEKNSAAQASSSELIVSSIRDLGSAVIRGTSSIVAEIATLRREGIERDEARRIREEELRVAAESRENEERARLQPRLRARVWIRGAVLHHIVVTISNQGMDAANLTVDLLTGNLRVGRQTIARIPREGSIDLDFGDVSQLPRDERIPLTVTCRAFDSVGHPYRFVREFQYLRVMGPLGLMTQSVDVQPPGHLEMAVAAA
jgi:hypothetical protein